MGREVLFLKRVKKDIERKEERGAHDRVWRLTKRIRKKDKLSRRK